MKINSLVEIIKTLAYPITILLIFVFWFLLPFTIMQFAHLGKLMDSENEVARVVTGLMWGVGFCFNALIITIEWGSCRENMYKVIERLFLND